MIDHSAVQMRWIDSAEKRRWMRALAMLLQVMKDSDILRTDRQRAGYKLVRARLKQEFGWRRTSMSDRSSEHACAIVATSRLQMTRK